MSLAGTVVKDLSLQYYYTGSPPLPNLSLLQSGMFAGNTFLAYVFTDGYDALGQYRLGTLDLSNGYASSYYLLHLPSYPFDNVNGIGQVLKFASDASPTN